MTDSFVLDTITRHEWGQSRTARDEKGTGAILFGTTFAWGGVAFIQGGLVYHILNRANARMRLFEKEADYAAFERVLVALRAMVMGVMM